MVFHFISLPLTIHPDHVEKLSNFQRLILGVSASNVDSDKDDILSECSVDEIDEATSPSVPVKQPVQEEKHCLDLDVHNIIRQRFFRTIYLSAKNLENGDPIP